MNKIEKILDYSVVDEKEIPSIPLYMDQLTFLLEDNLSKLNRNDGDKTLTKTMINNYVKGKVVEAPLKKKYTKDQIMKLTMIYQMKNVLSISDLKIFFDVIGKSDETIDKYYGYYKSEQIRVSKEMERFKSVVGKLKEIDEKELVSSDIDKNIIKEVISLSIEADLKRRISELLIDSL
ncbi:MAG: DUF1836 domain-containing protein [Acidaminobacteraceae bacterium]